MCIVIYKIHKADVYTHIGMSMHAFCYVRVSTFSGVVDPESGCKRASNAGALQIGDIACTPHDSTNWQA